MTVAGEKLGYVESKKELKNEIEKIVNQEEPNIAYIELKAEPEYEFKFLKRTENTEKEQIIEKIKLEDTTTVYKYYEVALDNETKTYVDTLEVAEELANEIKADFNGEADNLNISINEIYTQDLEAVNNDTLKIESKVPEVAVDLIEENQAIAIVNDIKFAYLPVSGRITSRYGESSSLRKSTHTGLDIACKQGTPIQVVSHGKVTFAERSGSYGNLVKVDHGNGVETWYAHCSKICVEVGQEVIAGDTVALVGSTGNATGPHLHFEIRINGTTINPQKYVY